MNNKLIDTIKEDCRYYEKLTNFTGYYLYLNECKDSEQSGLYQLILNGCEVWYGTLNEINAVVKTMIKLIEKAGDYYG